MTAIKRLLDTCFLVTLAAFLLGGAVVVFSQLVGVLAGQPELVTWSQGWLANWTFSAATVCSLLAFCLSYGRRAVTDDGDQGEE